MNSLNITSYVNDRFDVVYMSESIEDVADAEEFFMIEEHGNTTLKKENYLFIKTFINLNGAAFVESFPSMSIVQKGETTTAYGWDMPDQDLYDLTLIKIDALVDLQKKIWDKLSQIVEENRQDESELSILLKRNFALEVHQKSLLRSLHPIRTKSMIDTLHSIDELRNKGEIEGKVFFVAGRAHLQEANASEFPLQSLYDELKNRKAVILKSKILKNQHFIKPLLYAMHTDLPSLKLCEIFNKID